MKVTKALVALFEADQQKYSTTVALKNILWLQSIEQLRDLGVERTRTEYREDSAPRPH